MAKVDLDTETQALVDAEIATGRYRDARDVVRAGLTLLKRETDGDRLDGIRKSLADALADPRPSIPSDVVFERLARRHLERLKTTGGT